MLRRFSFSGHVRNRPVLQPRKSAVSGVVGLYRHYKNKHIYRVLDVVIHADTQERMVLYEELVPAGLRFVRPLDTFTELLDHDGRVIQRFEKLS